MPDTEEVVRATEEQRCAIITEAEEKLAALGIEVHLGVFIGRRLDGR